MCPRLSIIKYLTLSGLLCLSLQKTQAQDTASPSSDSIALTAPVSPITFQTDSLLQPRQPIVAPPNEPNIHITRAAELIPSNTLNHSLPLPPLYTTSPSIQHQHHTIGTLMLKSFAKKKSIRRPIQQPTSQQRYHRRTHAHETSKPNEQPKPWSQLVTLRSEPSSIPQPIYWRKLTP